MNDSWTEVISSKRSILDLKLREVWKYRDLILMFVRRDIVATYKQTVLGPFWFFISPLVTVFMYSFVFNTMVGIKTDGIPAPLFYLAGTTLWNYFQQSFLASSNTFITNAGIFGKVYFPRLISPMASTVSNLIKFFIQITVFVGLITYYIFFRNFSLHIDASVLLLFPFLLVLMAGIALGVGIITAAITSKYRDLQMFISYGVSLLMFATPVIYPISQIPEKFHPYIMLNPIAPIIEAFRYSIFGVGVFSWDALLYSTGFMVIVLFIGIIIFNQVEKNFMDTV